jgi:hypothetical protein
MIVQAVGLEDLEVEGLEQVREVCGVFGEDDFVVGAVLDERLSIVGHLTVH